MEPTHPDDRIELRGLRVLGTHGVLAEEQQRPQPFELDLDVVVDTAAAAVSDDLADAVDYAALAAAAVDVVAGRPHRLLESLAAAVADAVLARPGVRQVTVAVRKLRPPVPFDLDHAGVRLTRPSR